MPSVVGDVVGGAATVLWTVVYFVYFLFKGKAEWKCGTQSKPVTKICCVDGDCSEHRSQHNGYGGHSDAKQSHQHYDAAPKPYQNSQQYYDQRSTFYSSSSSGGGWLSSAWNRVKNFAGNIWRGTKHVGSKLLGVFKKAFNFLRRVFASIFNFLRRLLTSSAPSQTLPAAAPKPFKAGGDAPSTPSYNKVSFEPSVEMPEKEKLNQAIDNAINGVDESSQDDDEPTIMENVGKPKGTQERIPPTSESFYYERVFDDASQPTTPTAAVPPRREREPSAPPPPPPPPPPAKPIRVPSSVERDTTTPGKERKEVRNGIGGFNRNVLDELEETQRTRHERGLSAQREMTQSCHPDMAQWKHVEESDRSAASTRASSVGPMVRRLEHVVSRVNDDANDEANFVFRPKNDGYLMGRSVFSPIEEAEQMRNQINKHETSLVGTGPDRNSRQAQRNDYGSQRRARTVGPYEQTTVQPYSGPPARNPFAGSANYRKSPYTSHSARRSKTPVTFDRNTNFGDHNEGSAGAVESTARQWPPPSNATGAVQARDEWVGRSMHNSNYDDDVDGDSGLVTTMCRRVVERKREDNWKWHDPNGRLVDERNQNTWKGELDTLLRDGPNEGRHWSRTVERLPTGDTRFQDVNRQYNRDFVVESVVRNY